MGAPLLACFARMGIFERGSSADLAATFTDKHPKMRNIQAQIADVNKKIKEREAALYARKPP